MSNHNSFQSNAEWKSAGFTKDKHHTREEAEQVCTILGDDGISYGGSTEFPIRTWVTIELGYEGVYHEILS